MRLQLLEMKIWRNKEYCKTGEFIDEAPEWDSDGSTEGSSSDQIIK